MTQGYTQERTEKMASAQGMSLPISMKHAVEVSKFLRGKKVSKAKAILERVIKKEEAIPFTRFNWDVGHRKGTMASGRYPEKTSKEILRIINSAEKNAQQKGLATEQLVLKQVCAKKGSNTPRYGRHRGRNAKKTHIEVIVEEQEEKKEKQ